MRDCRRHHRLIFIHRFYVGSWTNTHLSISTIQFHSVICGEICFVFVVVVVQISSNATIHNLFRHGTWPQALHIQAIMRHANRK